eukprot:1757160-Karenia_brevis.AAC.1
MQPSWPFCISTTSWHWGCVDSAGNGESLLALLQQSGSAMDMHTDEEMWSKEMGWNMACHTSRQPRSLPLM